MKEHQMSIRPTSKGYEAHSIPAPKSACPEIRARAALAMIELAEQIDKPRNREERISFALQYGKGIKLRRDEVEWVLDHTVEEVFNAEAR